MGRLAGINEAPLKNPANAGFFRIFPKKKLIAPHQNKMFKKKSTNGKMPLFGLKDWSGRHAEETREYFRLDIIVFVHSIIKNVIPKKMFTPKVQILVLN